MDFVFVGLLLLLSYLVQKATLFFFSSPTLLTNQNQTKRIKPNTQHHKKTQKPLVFVVCYYKKFKVVFLGMVMAAAESEFHVLAVDDSLLDRKLIERLLKTSSFQVTTVDSGSKALEFLGFHGDDNRRIPDSPSVSSNNNQVVEVNLVMTDYCMPGMTGYDLLKKIKESSFLKDIPVVIMSSENVPSRISRCLEEGAEEFFLKPVRQSDLNRLKPHLMKTKFKDDQKDDKITEDEEEEEQRPHELKIAETESQTQQQQQQQHQLWSNNNGKRKSMDETILPPDRTRPRYADIAAPV